MNSGRILRLVNALLLRRAAYTSTTWLTEYLKRINVGRLLDLAEWHLQYISRLLFARGPERQDDRGTKEVYPLWNRVYFTRNKQTT
jgi:hypothetical protein